MAYAEFINVSNVQTLVDLIVQFAAANGWTVERNDIAGANRTATVRIPGVSDYVHIYNQDQNTLYTRQSIGYTAAAAPAAQPLVAPNAAMSNVLPGPYPRVKLFSNGAVIHVAVAVAATSQYRHHTFGVLEKAGQYDGGTFSDGTYWGSLTGSYSGYVTPAGNNVCLFGYSYNEAGCGIVRADSTEDGRANSYHLICSYFGGALPVRGQATAGIGTLGLVSSTATSDQDNLWLGRALGGADENVFSGRSIFHPVQLSVRRVGATPYISPIGVVTGLRACYLETLDPEQEVVIGDETWVVFPWMRKLAMSTASNAPPASGNYGWAVRKA